MLWLDGLHRVVCTAAVKRAHILKMDRPNTVVLHSFLYETVIETVKKAN